jgi:hypothetical protein
MFTSALTTNILNLTALLKQALIATCALVTFRE